MTHAPVAALATTSCDVVYSQTVHNAYCNDRDCIRLLCCRRRIGIVIRKPFCILYSVKVNITLALSRDIAVSAGVVWYSGGILVSRRMCAFASAFTLPLGFLRINTEHISTARVYNDVLTMNIVHFLKMKSVLRFWSNHYHNFCTIPTRIIKKRRSFISAYTKHSLSH